VQRHVSGISGMLKVKSGKPNNSKVLYRNLL